MKSVNAVIRNLIAKQLSALREAQAESDLRESGQLKALVIQLNIEIQRLIARMAAVGVFKNSWDDPNQNPTTALHFRLSGRLFELSKSEYPAVWKAYFQGEDIFFFEGCNIRCDMVTPVIDLRKIPSDSPILTTSH